MKFINIKKEKKNRLIIILKILKKKNLKITFNFIFLFFKILFSILFLIHQNHILYFHPNQSFLK